MRSFYVWLLIDYAGEVQVRKRKPYQGPGEAIYGLRVWVPDEKPPTIGEIEVHLPARVWPDVRVEAVVDALAMCWEDGWEETR